MKDMKMKRKIGLGFLIIDVILVFMIWSGYNTAKKMLTVDDPKRYQDNYQIFCVVAFVFAIIVMSMIYFAIMNSLKYSLSKLSDVADSLAEGRVDVELNVENHDEFGEMIEQYRKVLDNIRYQAKIAQEVAEGNLTVDVVPKSGQDLMGNSLKKLVNRNLHALTSIDESAYQVMTSSSQVASASEALAQGSTEQASAIEEITASIDDIAEKTKQNASEANQATNLVAETIVDVKQGNERMKEMVTAMQDINKSSESISKIIKVIDDIAFQTNILALNAAVEAARAGEAGKGFAVVAEEVRNLAAKSAAAAAETAELIEDSIHKVNVGSSLADETAKALEKINEVVTESAQIINGIADASNYQATAIAQVDQAIEQVSQVVQNNSATSEECAAASVELSEQANRMLELISVYNLGNNRQAVSGNSSMSYQAKRNKTERNEQIISLTGDFGKY